MNATEIIKQLTENFTTTQIVIIKSILMSGGWGNADFELNNGKTIMGFGYPTEDAKENIDFLTGKQIAGHISAIAKKIKENNFDFIQHITDYWDEGKTNDGMLFFPYDASQDLEKWAKS